MAAPVLGIDLGTTNSVVSVAEGGRARALPDADGNRILPSVVSFHPSGEVLVGHAARERRLLDAANTVYSIKRLIGRPFRGPEVQRAQERFPFKLLEAPNRGVLVEARGDTYALPEISAFVLREVRRIAESALSTECTRAVITVPANFNELQRSATKAAGKVAGLDVLRILNEPTAAALAYGYGKGSREKIAVYDFGGGTFDVTILELAGDVFEVIATAGDTFLGGDDLDLMIAEKMADAFLAHHRFDPRQDPQAFERLRAAAEWAKCQLSSEAEVHLRVEELAYGEGGSSLDLTFGLSRDALEKMVRPSIGRTFDVCEEAMRIAKVRPTQLDNVILVGGSTRIPLVREMVAEYFGRKPLDSIDPDLVVAHGAALQGYALRGQESASAPPATMGRVALKKATLQGRQIDQEQLRARKEALRKEISAARPVQPAFAPPPPPPPLPKPPPLPQMEREEPSDEWLGPKLDEDEHTLVRRSPFFDEEQAAAARSEAEPPAPPPPPPPPPPPLRAAPGVLQSRAVAVGAVKVGTVPLVPSPIRSSVPPSAVVMPPSQRPPPLPASGPEPTAPAPMFPDAPPPPPPPAAPPTAPMFPVAERAPAGRPAPASATAPEFGAAAAPPAAAPPEAPMFPPAAPQAPMFPEPASAPAALPSAQGSHARADWSAAAPPPAAPPLLLDVTPHSLGVETVDGFCEHVIKRNAAIPVEQTRVFTTASDLQESVRVRVVQGESRRMEENQALGEVELSGIRLANRGAVKIGVTFVMDADGTLGVKARDLDTGREQMIRIRLVGGIAEDEIARMAQRHAAVVQS